LYCYLARSNSNCPRPPENCWRNSEQNYHRYSWEKHNSKRARYYHWSRSSSASRWSWRLEKHWSQFGRYCQTSTFERWKNVHRFVLKWSI